MLISHWLIDAHVESCCPIDDSYWSFMVMNHHISWWFMLICHWSINVEALMGSYCSPLDLFLCYHCLLVPSTIPLFVNAHVSEGYVNAHVFWKLLVSSIVPLPCCVDIKFWYPNELCSICLLIYIAAIVLLSAMLLCYSQYAEVKCLLYRWYTTDGDFEVTVKAIHDQR